LLGLYQSAEGFPIVLCGVLGQLACIHFFILYCKRVRFLLLIGR
jgi:hypothetical protein